MKTRTIVAALFALALACVRLPVATAAEPGMLSMLVTGRITITADGAVAGYALDKPELLSKDIVALVDASVRRWQFEPLTRDGRAVPGSAGMTLGLVARKAGDGQYRAAIRSASFSDDEVAIAGIDLAPPRYPVDAARAGVGGVVYLVVLVGRDGRVEDAVAEQVDLDADSRELSRVRLRRALADAALDQARKWTFTAPPAGSDAAARTVRVPTDFTVLSGGNQPPAYGRWKAYFPGPRSSAPWLQDVRGDAAPIAASAGAVQPLRPALVLKTPLDAS